MNRSALIAAFFVFSTLHFAFAENLPTFTLEKSIPLPIVRWTTSKNDQPLAGEKPPKIHTQGVLVTERHIFVTGRWETSPKRAVLVRFDRDDPIQRYQILDLTPTTDLAKDAPLDHPGGFDIAEDGSLWIPVARSVPQGPSCVLQISTPDQPQLADCDLATVWKVDDHVGAIAVEKSSSSRRVVGASWDTRHVYVWSREPDALNEPPLKIAQSEWLPSRPDWKLAVQDWKFCQAGPFRNMMIAGGIDKSDDAHRQATIDLIHADRSALTRIRMSQPSGVEVPVTNEGLAWYGGRLYLLPEDLGRGAKLLVYRLAAD